MEKTATLTLRSEASAVSPQEVKESLNKYHFFSKSVGWNEAFSNESGSYTNCLTNNGDGTVIDKNTALMWQQSCAPCYTNWEDAQEYINHLNSSKFAGYMDWRLPTIEELSSLIMHEQMKGDLFIDPLFSDNMWFWSADTVSMDNAPQEDLVWTANYHYGAVYWLDKNQGQDVRAVRSLPEMTNLPQKAATLTLRADPQNITLEDAKQLLTEHNFFSKDIKWNREYANESGSFTGELSDVGNGTIIDSTTGLQWQRGASPSYCRWYDAKAYIDSLNEMTFAGHSDWRLPTVDEFASLMRKEQNSEGLYINPLFSNRMWFWCADTLGGDELGFVWTANFHYGTIFSLEKNQGHDVRAVRTM